MAVKFKNKQGAGIYSFPGNIVKVPALTQAEEDSITGTEGDIFFNSEAKRLKLHNGTVFKSVANTEDLENLVDKSSTETVGGAKTFTESMQIGTDTANRNLVVKGDVTASSFLQSSLRELKTNIVPYKNDATALVNSLNIVEFDYKKGNKDNIGVITDETPSQFLSKGKDSVNLYNTIFVQAKAIQELSKKNDELEERLLKLEKLLGNG